jgi:hypothetical protein
MTTGMGSLGPSGGRKAMDWQRSVLLFALFTGCVGGCSSGPWGGSSSRDASGAGSSTAGVASASRAVSDVFHQASHKVAQAFQRKPKVTPAHDPAALSSPPGPLSSDLYLRAALWSENQGALATAGQQYEKALELDPRSAMALVAYARFHDRLGHVDEATQLYERALAAAPERAGGRPIRRARGGSFTNGPWRQRRRMPWC